jgi:hypothetical protein
VGVANSSVSNEQREFAKIVQKGLLENEFEDSQFKITPKQINHENLLAGMVVSNFEKCDCYIYQAAGIKHFYYEYSLNDPITSNLGAVDSKTGKRGKSSYICRHCNEDDIILYGYLIKHLEIVTTNSGVKRTMVSRTFLQPMNKPIKGDKSRFLLDILMTTCSVRPLALFDKSCISIK